MFPIILTMMIFVPRKKLCHLDNPHYLWRDAFHVTWMLFYPADAFPVSRPNTSSTYQKVERRIIHSDDYQEMGSTTEGSSLTHESRIQRKCYSKEDYHFFLFGKKILLMIISQISFCLNTERQKFNNTVIGHHSVLLGLRNYHIWSKHIISTLSAYSVLSFCRWNSHVCGTPCWSRPYKSSTEVKNF